MRVFSLTIFAGSAKFAEMTITLIKSEERGHANYGWLDAYYSYSFARYYNPARMGFGALRVLNDDTIAPNNGFPAHGHRDMEIITIMLAGRLTHKDSLGNEHVLEAGQIQVMSAGTGVVHSEMNASVEEEAKLIQVWILTSKAGQEPRYAEAPYLSSENEITTLVGPEGDAAGALEIRQQAWIRSGNYPEDREVEYTLQPGSYGIKIFVLTGAVEVEGRVAKTRDALEITEAKTLTLRIEANTKFLLFEVNA